ncbi:MAG: FixH family protein [Saprospiraceae bacterium]|nr:FixH family protein [Saprospiraceae bacterium]
MKFNWGHGIAIFFTFFVCATIFQVIKSREYDHTLVKEDYYIDDIQLDELMVKKENAIALSGLAISQNDQEGTVTFTIPHTGRVQGNVLFSSPVDKRQDRAFPIVLSGDQMAISIRDLRKGMWNIQMDWKDDVKSYVYGEKIILP